MSVETISLLVGVLLSLAFSYVPGLKQKFEVLEPARKQLVLLGIMFLVVAGAYLLSFVGMVNLFTPDKAGLFAAIEAFVLAVIANAGTYKATNYIAE